MPLSLKDFTGQAKNEIEYLYDSYSHTMHNYNTAFTQWLLELLFPAINSDLAFSFINLDDKQSLNINASYKDEESGVYYLISTYFDPEPDKYILGPGVIYNLIDLYNKLHAGDDSYSSYPVLEVVKQALDEGYSLSIVLALFGKLDPSTDLSAILEKYELNDTNFKFYDIYKLRRLYAGLDEEIDEKTVALSYLNCAEYSGPIDAIVGNVSAHNLKQTFKDVVPTVYDVNLRTPLGSTKINKEMRNTLAAADNKYFWYYNNGITILCKKYELDTQNKTVHITSPRIVNGAQTTDTIIKSNIKAEDNIALMVRIIAALPGSNQIDEQLSKNPDVLQDIYLSIARFTNSQNPIELPDFRSNEEVQRRLHTNFKELGWFYEHRRGQWENCLDKDTYRKNGKPLRIKMTDLAQRWFAFDGSPAIAIREKLSLFEEEGHYKKIFMLSRDVKEYLIAYLFFEQIQERLKDKIKKAKDDAEKAIEAGNKIPITAQNFLIIGRATKLATAHLTAILGNAIKEKYGKYDSVLLDKLMPSVLSEKLVNNTISDLLDTLFRKAIQIQNERYKTMHRLLSESETFPELYDIFKYVLENEESKGRDILAF